MDDKYEMRSMLRNMNVTDLREVSKYFGESLTNQTGGYLNKKQLVDNLLGGGRSIHNSQALPRPIPKTWHTEKATTADQFAKLRQYITLGNGSNLYKECYDSISGDCSKPVYLTGKFRIQTPITDRSIIELEIGYKRPTRSTMLGGPSRWAKPYQLMWKRS